MRKEIFKYKAPMLSLDEHHGMLYLTANSVRALQFPSLEPATMVKGYPDSLATVSPNGNFVSLMAEGGHLAVYRTENLEEKIFQKKWKNMPVCGDAVFWGEDEQLLIPIQDKVYALDLANPSNLTIIFGDGEEEFGQEAFTRKGRVSGISVCGHDILIVHQLPGDRIRYKSTLLHGLYDRKPLHAEHPLLYDTALFDNRGGICLFCRTGLKPMRYYAAFTGDLEHADAEVVLPGYMFPHFSRNGKYLSIYDIACAPGKVNGAWLIDTSTWKVVDEVMAQKYMIWSTGFSNKDTYWLVSSDRPWVISVPE